jgi:hypothetical protein
MDFESIRRFLIASSIDIYELVLTGRLDLASQDGFHAAKLAHETFRAQESRRQPLDRLGLEMTEQGKRAYSEVLAFAFAWVDSTLQLAPAKHAWLKGRQQMYGDLLTGLVGSGQFLESDIPALDDLMVRRTEEYGPSPAEAFLALAVHLQPICGHDSLLLAACTGTYVVGASAEIANQLDVSSD